MSASSSSAEPAWEEIAPHLDACLDQLPAHERYAIVLHYLEDWSRPLAELRRVLKPGGELRHHLGAGSADAGEIDLQVRNSGPHELPSERFRLFVCTMPFVAFIQRQQYARSNILKRQSHILR